MTAMEAAELWAAISAAEAALDAAGQDELARRLYGASYPLRRSLESLPLPGGLVDTAGWPAESSGKTTLTEAGK